MLVLVLVLARAQRKSRVWMGGYSRESGDGDTKKVGFVWCVWCFVCIQYYPHRLWCFLVDAVLTQRKSVYTRQTDRLGVLFGTQHKEHESSLMLAKPAKANPVVSWLRLAQPHF